MSTTPDVLESTVPSADRRARRASLRRWASIAATTAALAALWLVLALPADPLGLGPTAFLVVPIEGVILAAALLVVPRRWRRTVAALVGVLVAVVAVVKVLDIGFQLAFGRPSDPIADWVYLGSGVDLLSVSVGRGTAIALLVIGAAAVLLVLVGTPWATVRVVEVAARHRPAALTVLAGMTVVWTLAAVLGVRGPSGAPVASAASAFALAGHVAQAIDGMHDQQTFAEAAAVDPLRAMPADDLLSSLRGKDVIVAFVESYGRVAVEDPQIAPGVDAVLDRGTKTLAGVGYQARSAFLTSPTFGGLSWLAHSTLQSGLWVDTQQRYDHALATDRLTLSGAFQRAGWRTVSDVPSDGEDWPEGEAFYGFDKVYDSRNMNYAGPRFGYATMPDQYVLSALWRNELLRTDRQPVMAEVDLVSSHTPWTPLPSMVDWSTIGNGAVFRGMPEQGVGRDVLWRDTAQVRAAYGRSVEYSLQALIDFVQRFGPLDERGLVLVMLGDHQPATIVSGVGASHDVPISIVTSDSTMLERVDSWDWEVGLNPGPAAPMLRMDAFRDQFVAAFS